LSDGSSKVPFRESPVDEEDQYGERRPNGNIEAWQAGQKHLRDHRGLYLLQTNIGQHDVNDQIIYKPSDETAPPVSQYQTAPSGLTHERICSFFFQLWLPESIEDADFETSAFAS
jgi:hypothetical protein